MRNHLGLALLGASLLLTSPLAAKSHKEEAEAGIRRDTEFVQLNQNYNDYLARIAFVDVNIGEIHLDNGSRWQLDQFELPGLQQYLTQWQVGDIIGFSSRSFTSQPNYGLYNRSRDQNIELRAFMVTAPDSMWPTYLFVENIDFSNPSSGLRVDLNNGLSWFLPMEYARDLGNWNPGDPVMLDITEDLEFQSGVLMIKERLVLINLEQHRWVSFQDTDFAGQPPMPPPL